MNDKLICASCGAKKDNSVCDNCGKQTLAINNTSSDNSQLLVLWGLIVIAFVTTYWFITDILITALDKPEIYNSIRYLSDFMSLLLAIAPLLFVLSLKNKTLRVIGAISGAIIISVRLHWLIKSFMPVEEFVYFQF